MTKEIPIQTIQTIGRSIFKEASSYGFAPIDMVRLINELMDLCTADDGGELSAGADKAENAAVTAHADVGELPIHGQRVSIRAYQPDDFDLLQRWLPDKYGRFFVLSSATAQTVTIESLTDSPSNRLGIITRDGRPIGAMAYLDISETQKRAELRKLIGDPDSRGQGLAEEATRLWIRYGMGSLGLEKIFVSTLQTHIANIRLNEAVGFRVEGLLRNEVLIDGRRFDVLRMGIWRD
ncbi:MAG: GNAT family protein [Woeseiaceae bacterium]|nr:GNAT family protein [Woeseiaceae bacterium]